MASSSISYLWRDKDAPIGFRAGVSLHSHTNQSRETLDFLANFGNQFPVMRRSSPEWSAKPSRIMGCASITPRAIGRRL